MYEAFYGLRERPFNLTPDPKFLFLSEKHKEAFAHLLYGIKNHSGFVMLSGEIGTGKTTICRNLLNQLDTQTEVAFVFNPPLNPLELLKRINGEFGIDKDADTVLELTDTLNLHLLAAAAGGRSCVLIIDEAQNLAPIVLEQIRLLSNLETETDKLLQIILIGQPELADKLALHELRQLNQRITARYHLKELDQRETQQYIGYRLHVAGARRKVQFNKAACEVIFRKSGGTPRVINALSDRCLLIGYTQETHTITAPIAKQAAKEIRGAEMRSRSRPQGLRRGWNLKAVATALALLVLLAATITFFSRPVERLAGELNKFNSLMSGETPATPAPSPLATPEAEARALDATDKTPAPAPAAKAAVERLRQESPLAARVLERLAPEPVTVAPEEKFAALFSSHDGAATGKAALAAILAAWDRPLNGDYPARDDADSLTAFLTAHGLSRERLNPALDQLLAINLPALVRVKDDAGARWLALTAVTDAGELTLTSGMGETITLPRNTFLARYAGEAIVPWRDPAPDAPLLRAGKQGAPVEQLKRKLRSIGRIASDNTSNTFDSETAKAISRIQFETGLIVDGMAGKQVRMVLASWLPDADTPSVGLSPVIVHAEAETASAPEEAAPEPETTAPAPAPTPKPTPRSAAPATPPAPKPAKVETPTAEVSPPEPLPEPAPEVAVPPVPESDNAMPAPVQEDIAPIDGTRDSMETPPKTETSDTGDDAMVSVKDLTDLPAPAEMEVESVEKRPTVTAPVAGSAPLVPKDY